MACDRIKGFSLVELMVVVFIIAVLLTLTLPGYQEQRRKTGRALGAAELLEVMMRQEQYFVDHKRYAGDLNALGYLASPYAINSQGSAVAAVATNRIYLIDIATRQNAYTLFAIPQLSQAQDRACGTLSLDSLGIKLATGTKAAQDCW